MQVRQKFTALLPKHEKKKGRAAANSRAYGN